MSPGKAFFQRKNKYRIKILILPVFCLLLALSAVLLTGCGGTGSGESADRLDADRSLEDDPAIGAETASGAADRETGGRQEPGPEDSLEADSSGKGETAVEPQEASAGTSPTTALQPAENGYQAPEMMVSVFHEDQAWGENGVLVDLSAVSDGYIGVSAESSGKMKFQVLKGEETYTYSLSPDGTPSIFPLQMGDGQYSFRALENVSGSKYAVIWSMEENIVIDDEFRPYLCASDYVKYTEDSACVKKARELAAGAQDANGLISAVYDFVCTGVTYDKEKAKTVQAGYMPDPDETMETGKGICFDYASLAAAMLRSQGIPCKLIFGYVSPKDVYHAWNMFYTEEDGWISVKFEVAGREWNRLDLTFSSNGADGTFIGDGSNYRDVYCY